MKLAILASAVVGAAAFAPNSVSRQGTALNMAGDIKPKLKYVPCISTDDLPKAGRATSGVAGGLAICIAVDSDGKLYALGDKCPPISQPLSFGNVDKGFIQDPVLGTKFNLKTGQVAEGDWCTSPIGKILGGLFEPSGVPIYPLKVKGKVVEVQVDVNYKAAFESQYWSGVLDAQGKSNGKYY
jgi:nitrite reductase/ring-hydroxylating ferredoxin subunit